MKKCKYCGIEFSDKVLYIHECRCEKNPANIKVEVEPEKEPEKKRGK